MQIHTQKSKLGTKKLSGTQTSADPVPLPEHGSHAHSHAAHLGNPMQERTSPAVGFGRGASPGQLREPPQQISRIGKQHRGG